MINFPEIWGWRQTKAMKGNIYWFEFSISSETLHQHWQEEKEISEIEGLEELTEKK
jgi:hypothetical protein